MYINTQLKKIQLINIKIKLIYSYFFILILLFIFPYYSFSNDKIYKKVVKSTCIESFNRSEDDVKKILLNQSKRAAVEEIFGELIESSTFLKNGMLKSDDIQTFSFGLVRIKGDPIYSQGKDFGQSCIKITCYVNKDDIQRFKPKTIPKKSCITDGDVKLLKSKAKDNAKRELLTDYEPVLQKYGSNIIFPFLHDVKIIKEEITIDPPAYCVQIEATIYPLEILSFTNNHPINKAYSLNGTKSSTSPIKKNEINNAQKTKLIGKKTSIIKDINTSTQNKNSKKFEFYLAKPYDIFNHFSDGVTLDVNKDVIFGFRYAIGNFGIDLSTLQYKATDSIYSSGRSYEYNMHANNVNAELFYNKNIYNFLNIYNILPNIYNIPMFDTAFLHFGLRWKHTKLTYSDTFKFLQSSNELKTKSNSGSLVFGFVVKKYFLNNLNIFFDLNRLVGYASGYTINPPKEFYYTSLENELEKRIYSGYYNTLGLEYIYSKFDRAIKMGFKFRSFTKDDSVNSFFTSFTF